MHREAVVNLCLLAPKLHDDNRAMALYCDANSCKALLANNNHQGLPTHCSQPRRELELLLRVLDPNDRQES